MNDFVVFLKNKIHNSLYIVSRKVNNNRIQRSKCFPIFVEFSYYYTATTAVLFWRRPWTWQKRFFNLWNAPNTIYQMWKGKVHVIFFSIGQFSIQIVIRIYVDSAIAIKLIAFAHKHVPTNLNREKQNKNKLLYRKCYPFLHALIFFSKIAPITRSINESE